MTDTIIVLGQIMEICTCGDCGVIYTVPKVVRDRHREVGGFSHCPNGHQWGWTKDGSEREKLRLEHDRLKQQIVQKNDEIRAEQRLRQAAEQDAAAAKTRETKLKKRVNAGTCPCCKRTFRQLTLHMKQKHPTFESHLKVVK